MMSIKHTIKLCNIARISLGIRKLNNKERKQLLEWRKDYIKCNDAYGYDRCINNVCIQLRTKGYPNVHFP